LSAPFTSFPDACAREGDDRRRNLLRLLGQERMTRAVDLDQLDAIARRGLHHPHSKT
jgi:hypothetical protein